jgi:hypothetical protein
MTNALLFLAASATMVNACQSLRNNALCCCMRSAKASLLTLLMCCHDEPPMHGMLTHNMAFGLATADKAFSIPALLVRSSSRVSLQNEHR